MKTFQVSEIRQNFYDFVLLSVRLDTLSNLRCFIMLSKRFLLSVLAKIGLPHSLLHSCFTGVFFHSRTRRAIFKPINFSNSSRGQLKFYHQGVHDELHTFVLISTFFHLRIIGKHLEDFLLSLVCNCMLVVLVLG